MDKDHRKIYDPNTRSPQEASKWILMCVHLLKKNAKKIHKYQSRTINDSNNLNLAYDSPL